jgi:hypothetical protein
MRTSLNEIREAESFLKKEMNAGESLVFQAKLITNPRLRFNVTLQKRLMDVVRLYHLRKIKRDLQMTHRNLMQPGSSFQSLIEDIFCL